MSEGCPICRALIATDWMDRHAAWHKANDYRDKEIRKLADAIEDLRIKISDKKRVKVKDSVASCDVK